MRAGGESRIMNTRSATWTPPSPLPRIEPAITKMTIPGVVPLSAIENAPSTSPTTHDPRTATSPPPPSHGAGNRVSLRPVALAEPAPHEAGAARHDRQRDRSHQPLSLG